MTGGEAYRPSGSARWLLLGSLGLVVLPHLARFPAWLALLCVVIIGWRGLADARGWPLPSAVVRLALTIGSGAAVLATYHTLLGRDAGAALLTVMLCLKLLELRSVRDAMVVVFLGFFLVVSGFLYHQSIGAGIYLLAVSLALSTSLAALADRGGTFGPRVHLSTASRILLQSLPLMAVLFLLFPRLSTPLWGLPEDAFSGKTGLDDSLTMGSIANLADSDAVAFRVRFQGPPPPRDQLYWRGPTLWKTDGRRWERLPEMPGEPLSAHQALSGAVRYTITLEPHDRRWLFTLDLPSSVPENAQVMAGYELLADKPVRERRRDVLVSYPDYNADTMDPGIRQLASALPASGNNGARKLARQWRSESDEPRIIVQRALDHFRDEGFVYTRRPPVLGAEPVDRFLFGTRKGFCEHYAAAFTFLMRAAGIPARIVTGYQGGEFNRIGDYLVVRQRNAHAWSEVWLGEDGWVRVDPTAVIPPDRNEFAGVAERFQAAGAGVERNSGWLERAVDTVHQGWDALNHGWNRWVLAYGPGHQEALLKQVGFEQAGWRALAGLMTGAVVVVLGAIAVALLRKRPSHPDRAVELYAAFCAKLQKRGFVRRANEGPERFTERVSRDEPELAPVVRLVSKIYARLRYADAGERDHWLRRLERHVADFRP